MEDNESATAESGAATPESGVGTTNKASEMEAAAASDVETDEVEDFRGRNEELRMRFLECNRRIKEAQASGDVEAEAEARAERELIGNEFVELNVKLAVHNSSRFLIGDAEMKKDHLQAAMLGMWESFVGVDASKVDDVVVDEDGQVHSASGWNPELGAFSTFAGRHISGRARRSVKSSESAYTGMSYNTWSEKPKVDRARRELTAELGRTPTSEEIAAKAEVTIETVRACSTATPVSLQALVSDDGSTTLGDMLADTPAEETFAMSDVAEGELIARARQMSTLDLLVLVLRTGVSGRPPLTVNRTADKLCVGRGAAQLAVKRAMSALVPEKAIPQTVSCAKCNAELAYDWDNEPQLELSEFDLPEGLEDLTVAEHRKAMAEWTAKVNAAHAEEQERYDQNLVTYRAKARDAADKFVAKHRKHGAQASTDDENAELAALLA